LACFEWYLKICVPPTYSILPMYPRLRTTSEMWVGTILGNGHLWESYRNNRYFVSFKSDLLYFLKATNCLDELKLRKSSADDGKFSKSVSSSVFWLGNWSNIIFFYFLERVFLKVHNYFFVSQHQSVLGIFVFE
jgi:hypothetical protein